MIELLDNEKMKKIMDELKKQVNDSLSALSMFRNMHENDRDYIHAYCLAIAFYLDHYEGEKANLNKDNKEKQYYE